MTIQIFLADDHTVLRDGLRLLLEMQPDMRVVGDAANGRAKVSASTYQAFPTDTAAHAS